MRKAPEDSEEKRVREVLRRSIGESRLWTEARVCIRVVGLWLIKCHVRTLLSWQLFRAKQVNKRFCRTSGIRDSKEALSTEPEERARAGPNSKGQLASNREGQEQRHLFLFPSSISCHCLPWAKAKQKPKNKELVTLAPGAQREQRMILGEGRAQQTRTDFKGNKISG